jgi:hypothetical protein
MGCVGHTSVHSETVALVLGGPEVVSVVLNSSSSHTSVHSDSGSRAWGSGACARWASAPRSALRRPDASDAAGRSAGGSRRRHWQTAGCGARAFKRLRRTRSRAGISASLRAARVARTPQTQPGSRRAKACGTKGRLPGCGARAFERSLAEVVSERAFGGRKLVRALPRSYDRALPRRAGAPAPFRLRRPPWAATAQTARLAFAHAAEDGRARSEPESARPP